MKVLIFLVALSYSFLLLLKDKNFAKYINSKIASSKELTIRRENFDCTYSKLLCSFRTGHKFYAGCYPVFVKTLYNRTDCPKMKNSFLTGFVKN
jgi:hypothetical protein